MSYIPNYFYSVYQSVQRVDEYNEISVEDLNINDNEKKLLLDFCNNTFAAVPHDNDDLYSKWVNRTFPVDNLDQLPHDLNEILDNFVTFLLSSKAVNNSLVAGYKKGASSQTSTELENTFVHHMKNDPSWSLLLQSIGKDAFCKMISNTVILRKLPNNTYYQLSGQKLSGKLKANSYIKNITTDDNTASSQSFSPVALFLEPSISSSRKRPPPSKIDIVCEKKVKLSRRQKKKRRLEEEKKKRRLEEKENPAKRSRKKDDRSISRVDLFYSPTSFNTRNDGEICMKLPQTINKLQTSDCSGHEFNLSCIETIFAQECSSPRKMERFMKRGNKSIETLIEKISTNHNRLTYSSLIDSKCPKRLTSLDTQSMASTHSEVFNFIVNILQRTFPPEFWGSKNNFNVITKVVKQFISRHRNENISCKELLFKFKIKDCRWLAPSNRALYINSCDLQKRERILLQALTWVFNDYIKPIIRHSFYVTESAKAFNHVFYFRKDIWDDITKSTLSALKNTSYMLLGSDMSVGLDGINVGRLRLVPKISGFRVITTITNTAAGNSRSNQSKASGSNQTLRPMLKVLNDKKAKDPSLVGSSVLGGSQIFYQKFKDYKKNHFVSGATFYFVKVDIANCFDVIDQKKLLDILESILTSNTYNLQVLKKSVEMNVVKIDNEYYKRTKGIAQGSPLSTLLCSFFLGNFEKEKLGFLKNDSDGVLFTYVDDFLLITKNESYAKWFQNAVKFELPKFDQALKIKQEKCQSNLDNQMEEITWLGYKINTKTLDVSFNINKFDLSSIESAVTTEYNINPGLNLYNSCLRDITSNMCPLIMDTKLNSEATVVQSLKDIFIVAAHKLLARSSNLEKSMMGMINEDFTINMICEVSSIISSMIPAELDKDEILLKYFKSFYYVFVRKQTRYCNVVLYLKSRIQ